MSRPRTERAKETIEVIGKQIRKGGKRAARTLARTPELISLERKDRALKNELDHQLREVGLLALRMHQRSLRDKGGVSPFESMSPIVEGLDTVDGLQRDIKSNREKMDKVKVEMRHDR